ncbi:MAG: tRNA guanosine(34) transglycosylase Tgt [Armatimonadetes bacterium]|jgi:queuine tRNA-ribosyltransferase|nr:tRNA guanosine(34) transglycosylase Tgt [Armatimonadota bacterium]MDI9585413.1 tRNA guanosine(34) transglycosylase Tgt [Acidobacteriota bacterium]
MQFTLLAKDNASRARLGELRLAHATVRTPLFMPCASLAVVRACDTADIEQLGVQMLCCNAYHLWQRPGDEVVRNLGGLHDFMRWPGGILTDSGGFQVFSLAQPKDIIEEGVRFRSHLDGAKLMLTAEQSIAIQNNLGSDIAMAFDECAPYPVDREYIERSLERTLRWAQRTKDAHANPNQALFGIVQGGLYPDLRVESARRTVEMGFDGYALGGLSVGESKQQMLEAVEVCEPLLPEHSPRYVMGVGTPADIVSCVMRGVDMFDCVLPTRMARHGSLLTASGTLKIKNARFREDPRPLEEDCDCPACARYCRAWLHHLFRIQEATAWRLLSLHNVRFYKRLMARIRQAIQDGTLAELNATVLSWTRRDAACEDAGEREAD